MIAFDELKKIENKDKYLKFDSIIKNELNEKDKIINKNLKRN